MDKKKKIITIVSCALVAVLTGGIVGGLLLSKKQKPTDSSAYFSAQEMANYSYDGDNYATTTAVGYSSEILSENYERKIPEVHNEGLPKYPKYGSTLSLDAAGKSAMITESWNLCSINTRVGTDGYPKNTYNSMDAEGNLYLNGATPTKAGVPTKLYKHSAAASMYGGGLKDTEPALVKRVTLRPRGYDSYSVTGLYAPAGEVIKIQLSNADMNATGGLTIHIGQALYNKKANNIWAARSINRMPVILNTMVVTKSTATYDESTGMWTAYVGSFLGGPIYVHNTKATVNVTISGGVAYSHFILGYTSEEEFNKNKQSSAPYFDLEVWDHGVLHSGPKSYAKSFSYSDIYKAAVLWDKVACVATTNGSKQGIVFLYDPFVAAGAAVAFPGQMSVNCPAGWMSSSLNYNAIVNSGSWGNFHEYHHNFQNFGVGYTGEVTNNALNLVAYSLFTRISANRGMNNYGAQGLSGWNTYTSATWALQRVNTGQIGSTNGLAVYATLLHNFGQDAFIKARGSWNAAYFNKWASLTHQDFSYYTSKITAYANVTPAATNYPEFVPVSSVYQTGRSYVYDNVKRDIKTMQPYVIPYGKNFTVDLRSYSAPSGQYASGSIIIGDGFKYTVKNVSQPTNGKLVATDVKDVYTYIPNKNSKELLSGQIRVTLGITTTDGEDNYNGHPLDDVDLILEFQQSHESTKMTLERTTYTYDPSVMYTDAVTAYNNNFRGYTSVEERDHSNPTQNANTDIWLYPNDQRGNYPNAPENYFFHDNTIEVIDGKLYFGDDGKYRVYLRGRENCALYFSLDGKNYSLGATIKTIPSSNSHLFRPTDSNTYFDVQFDEGDVTVTLYVNGGATKTYKLTRNENSNKIENWLYVKEVLIVQEKRGNTNIRSYIGLGMKAWTEAAFTMSEKHYKADDTEQTDLESSDYAYIKTTYVDQSGSEVAYARRNKDGSGTAYYKKSGNTWVASNADEIAQITRNRMIEPTVTSNSQPYVNAYRSTYEFPDSRGFQSDYFYTKGYNYNFNYSDRQTYTVSPKLVSVSHASWDNTHPIAHLLDNNTGTGYHSVGGSANYITDKKPFNLVVDLGKTIKANHVTFYYYTHSSSNDKKNNVGMVKTFILYGSLTGNEEDWFEITSATDYVNAKSPSNVTFDFDTTEFRYYKLYVTKTDNNHYFAMNEIVFYQHTPSLDLSLTGNGANNLNLDADRFTFSAYNWRGAAYNSVFGHIYVGKKSATLTFKFSGTRIGFLTSNSSEFENKFEVYVDGKKVNSVPTLPVTGPYGVMYLSQKLTKGEHTVTLKCLSTVGLDSVVYYNETA